MSGRSFRPGGGIFLTAIWLSVAAHSHGAANSIVWNFVQLPATGEPGEVVACPVRVTNTGNNAWNSAHYLELRDQDGTRLSYLPVPAIAPGAALSAAFTLTLPARSGTYAYRFAALQHGVEYFGPVLTRTLVVRAPPLQVSLRLDQKAIDAGDRVTVRSAAGPDEAIAEHGLEGRALGLPWQTWAKWSAEGGDQKVASPQPDRPGIYELRAFAARLGEKERAYSERATLVVNSNPPDITAQPATVVATVGQSVTLSVGASGPDLVYQWRKDGLDLAGATEAVLSITSAQIAHGGNYTAVVANRGGASVSRAAVVTVNPVALPASVVEVWTFPAGGARRSVALTAARVGDVLSIRATSPLTAGAGWRHDVLVRRPAITTATALAPEDGSGLTLAHEAWNRDGWGNPHSDGGSYDGRITGLPAADIGRREPFLHVLPAGQTGSTRTVELVLDAPGVWLIRSEVSHGSGELIGASPMSVVTVAAPPLTGDPANMTYPYGRSDRFVGVFWNAGQAHRLWSTWRAEYQSAYGATWAVNWKLMWQPSPYFRRVDGGWLKPNPIADSPWQSFWSGHQVYAIMPDGAGGSTLTHDITSRTFAEKAALRLMDVGVDFVAVDYTNQFLEEYEDVFPAVNNLALAFQAVAEKSPARERVKLTAVVPANVGSGDWLGNGGFGPVAIARFNAKLTTLYERFARFESAWFHLEDDDGRRKPLLMLWVGASGEDQPDGKLGAEKSSQLTLADGRLMTEVFTIRWVGAYLSDNPRFLSGGAWTVPGAQGRVSGKYAKPKIWSYHEHHPSTATLAPGANGSAPAIEAITVQPLAAGRDRFGRAWKVNWPAGQGYHYETPVTSEPAPIAGYGSIWREALATARALNPRILLTTWAEFGSENDEPRPEMSVTIMDNNKFGTHFGDAFRDAVRSFKYQPPMGWIDTYATGGAAGWWSDVPATAPPAFRSNQTVRLQGWVIPNVATAFPGGSVKVLVNDTVRGIAAVGGAWNGATSWTFDLPAAELGVGRHAVKVIFDDGVGGTALAGVQFQGEPPRNTLSIVIEAP